MLLLSLPMISLLYLDTYEKQLLRAQESSMIQQARMLSAALTGASDLESEAGRIITNLNRRVDSRIRVIDANGRLLADSSVTTGGSMEDDEDARFKSSAEWSKSADYEPGSRLKAARDTILYRVVVYPINTVRNLILPPSPELQAGEYYSGKSLLDGPEVRSALEGRYGAATRVSSGGQRSINLYSAIPVFGGAENEAVIGAVLVSRSTFQLLNYLYELRLDIIKIFLIFLIISIVISFVLAMSLTVPVVRLKNEAGNILDESGNFRNHFTGFRRGDEIGELSRSLMRLSSDLEHKMEFIDKFTSDMLHELKNPLSAIKSAADMAAASPGKRPELIGSISEEEKRMERLLAELREVSSLENRFENERTEPVKPAELLPVILSRYGNVVFNGEDTGCIIRINVDRFVQAVMNPVDNAVSFSPEGAAVTVRLSGDDGLCVIRIEDSGPGLAPGAAGKVFDRFYSDRPGEDRGEHSGLGLAIVKSITACYGGSCSIENMSVGGCRFTLTFPVCTD